MIKPCYGRISCAIVLVLLLVGLQSCSGFVMPTSRFRSHKGTLLGASMLVPPADLTPAVDKFDRLPTVPFEDPLFMTAKGPSPAGPDPFKYVADELNPLSDFVKDLIVSENPVLTMAASHFFDQVSMHW